MRRVNEAVREVLSARIAEGLKDPRIGFVTVTSVETSPDLRHARVYVSVLGDEAARADTLAGLESAHGVLQQAIASELRMKRTPTLEFVYDESIDRGMRINELLEDDRSEHRAPDMNEALAELRRPDKLLLTTHENPDGDALGSLLAMHWILEQLGKDSVMFMSPDEFPLPYEYRHMDLRAAGRHAAARRRRAHDRLPRLRQHRPDAGRLPPGATACTSSTSTTTTTTPASARSTWWCPRPPARPRSSGTWRKELGAEITPRDRRRALHRASSPTPASSCTRTPRPRRTGWRPS